MRKENFLYIASNWKHRGRNATVTKLCYLLPLEELRWSAASSVVVTDLSRTISGVFGSLWCTSLASSKRIENIGGTTELSRTSCIDTFDTIPIRHTNQFSSMSQQARKHRGFKETVANSMPTHHREVAAASAAIVIVVKVVNSSRCEYCEEEYLLLGSVIDATG